MLPAAVEELLRFTNPLTHATGRFTTQDMTVGDVVIPAWGLPLPASRPRSAPCSPASLDCHSRSRQRNSAGVPRA
jgi:hypothetical protein